MKNYTAEAELPALVGDTNERNRVLWLEKTLTSIPAGYRILDAGAGEQQFRRFCGHLKYVSQDFAQYDGQGDGVGLQTASWNNNGLDIVGDIASIPEPDGSFDAIMCTEVFEHLPHPVEALREFSRLLRHGGEMIITAPFNSLTHFAPYHFYTGFSRYFYEHYLPEFGFDIREIAPNGNYFEYLGQEMNRVGGTAATYSKDKPSLLEKVAIKICKRMLSRFSATDRGSSELLNFGYHVRAVRNQPFQHAEPKG